MRPFLSASASAVRVSPSFFALSPLRRSARFEARSSSSARPAAPPGASAGTASAAGRMRLASRFSVRRWVPTSKNPMESSSSPQKSQRTGFAWAGEKKSSMPPRRENCPTPSTSSVRS